MTNRLTAEDARRLFEYNPVTGALYWKPRPVEDFKTKRSWATWNTKYSFTRCGSVMPANGYRKINVKLNDANIAETEHRIVWLIFHGDYPASSIDHIDGNRLNNKIENLRDVPQSENNKNLKRPSHNSTGVIGTSFDRATGLFNAHIYVRGKVKRLGRFTTIDQAAEARRVAEIELGYHPNHGRAG